MILSLYLLRKVGFYILLFGLGFYAFFLSQQFYHLYIYLQEPLAWVLENILIYKLESLEIILFLILMAGLFFGVCQLSKSFELQSIMLLGLSKKKCLLLLLGFAALCRLFVAIPLNIYSAEAAKKYFFSNNKLIPQESYLSGKRLPQYLFSLDSMYVGVEGYDSKKGTFSSLWILEKNNQDQLAKILLYENLRLEDLPSLSQNSQHSLAYDLVNKQALKTYQLQNPHIDFASLQVSFLQKDIYPEFLSFIDYWHFFEQAEQPGKAQLDFFSHILSIFYDLICVLIILLFLFDYSRNANSLFRTGIGFVCLGLASIVWISCYQFASVMQVYSPLVFVPILLSAVVVLLAKIYSQAFVKTLVN